MPALFFKRGFTLAEVLTSIALMTVIMVAVSAFQYNVFNYNRSVSISLNNTQEAQSIMKIVARELRSMEFGSNGTYPIGAAATSTVTFFADTDGDTLKEQIRYYLASTTLYRGNTVPSGSPLGYNMVNEKIKLLATGVRNASSSPVFEYFDNSYLGTTSAMTYPLNITNIRLIKVNLTIDSDPTKSPIPRTFSTQAELRNLKDNL